MPGTNLLNGLTYVLMCGDRDTTTHIDGTTGACYGGRFRRGVTEHWVAKLQKLLSGVGIRLDDRGAAHDRWGEAGHESRDSVFDMPTEWAIREFQIAATYPNALKAGALFPITDAQFRYTGRISGVLNSETRAVLGAWAIEELSIPIILSGFGSENLGDQTTGVDPLPSESNVWQDIDSQANSPTRIFSLDKSGEFYRDGDDSFPASDRDIDEYQVVGAITNEGDKLIGSITTSTHAWKRIGDKPEVLPKWLFDLADSESEPEKRKRQLRTFRILRANADVEAFGYFEGTNAHDDQIISTGMFHWTIPPKEPGELPGLLAYMRYLYPTDYHEAFGKFGVHTSRNWHNVHGSADGFALLQRGKGTYEVRNFSALAAEQERPVPIPEGNTPKKSGLAGRINSANEDKTNPRRYFRNWHSYYRFVMAARDINGYRRVMWDVGRMRLRNMMSGRWPNSGGPYPEYDGAPATIGQTFRSERTLAMLLRWHIKRPAHVISSFEVGPELQWVYQQLRTTPLFSANHDVTDWSSRHEVALAAKIREGFENFVSNDVTIQRLLVWKDPSELTSDLGLTKPEFLPDLLGFDIDVNLPEGQVLTGAAPAFAEAADGTALFIRFAEETSLSDTYVEYKRDNTPATEWTVQFRVPREASAPANETLTLKRRFRLTRTGDTINVLERPLLSEDRLPAVTETGMFPVDLSDLPRLKLKRDERDTNWVALTRADHPNLLDALLAGSSLQNDNRTKFINAIKPQLSLTEVVYPTTLAVEVTAANEEDAPRRWRVLVSNTHLKHFVLRWISDDLISVDPPGTPMRYGGHYFKFNESHATHIPQLRQDLTDLGFDPNLTGEANPQQYSRRLEAAVSKPPSRSRRLEAAVSKPPSRSRRLRVSGSRRLRVSGSRIRLAGRNDQNRRRLDRSASPAAGTSHTDGGLPIPGRDPRRNR
jgi:hypothetical protein